MFAMTQNQRDKVIGYSALSRVDHKYICLDGATYIAGSGNDMIKYLEDSLLNQKDYMIDRESMTDILHDYGDSHGAYALEVNALQNFKDIADTVHMDYKTEPYNSYDSEDPDVFIVEMAE